MSETCWCSTCTYIRQIESEIDEASKENNNLRKVLCEGSIKVDTDGERYRDIEVSFADTLREIASTINNGWEDYLVEKAREIDKALGDKGN